MAKFYMGPCVTAAIQGNSKACQSFDEQFLDIQDIIIILPEKEQIFYRPCFQRFQKENMAHCFQILGLIMAADQGGNSSLRAVKVLKKVMADGWPDICEYIMKKHGSIPFDDFWLNRAVHDDIVKIKHDHLYRQLVDHPVISQKRKLSRQLDSVLGPVLEVSQRPGKKTSIFSAFASGPGKGSKISSDEFCAFLYTASLHGKKIQDNTSLFKTLFYSCMENQKELMAEIHREKEGDQSAMIQ